MKTKKKSTKTIINMFCSLTVYTHCISRCTLRVFYLCFVPFIMYLLAFFPCPFSTMCLFCSTVCNVMNTSMMHSDVCRRHLQYSFCRCARSQCIYFVLLSASIVTQNRTSIVKILGCFCMVWIT